MCTHGINCKRGAACAVGKRRVIHHILSGCLLPSWDLITRVASQSTRPLSRKDRTPKIVRCALTDGSDRRIVGVTFPLVCLPDLRAALYDQACTVNVEVRPVVVPPRSSPEYKPYHARVVRFMEAVPGRTSLSLSVSQSLSLISLFDFY